MFPRWTGLLSHITHSMLWTVATQLLKTWAIISRFRRKVAENYVLPGYYAASSGNSLPTFRDNLSVPSSRFKEYWPLNYHYSLRNNPEEHSSQDMNNNPPQFITNLPSYYSMPPVIWAPDNITVPFKPQVHPRSWFCPGQSTGRQLDYKFPHFMEPQVSFHYHTPSAPIRIQINPVHALIPHVEHLPHLQLCLARGLSPSSIKTLYAPLLSTLPEDHLT